MRLLPKVKKQTKKKSRRESDQIMRESSLLSKITHKSLLRYVELRIWYKNNLYWTSNSLKEPDPRGKWQGEMTRNMRSNISLKKENPQIFKPK